MLICERLLGGIYRVPLTWLISAWYGSDGIKFDENTWSRMGGKPRAFQVDQSHVDPLGICISIYYNIIISI